MRQLTGLAFTVCLMGFMFFVGCGEGNNEPVNEADRPGDLDTTFGTAGRVVYSIGGPVKVTALEVDKDGKILVACQIGGETDSDFGVLRLLSDGGLDSTFGPGGGGITGADFGDTDLPHDMAVQSDGSIVVVGSSGPDFAVARFDPAGNLDASFGSGGGVVTDLGTGSVDTARAVEIQNDGRIVVAGHRRSSVGDHPFDIAVARYNTDGTLDTTFGNLGFVTTDSQETDEQAHDVLLLAESSILVAGRVGENLAVVKYQSDGALDGGFGDGGVALADVQGTEAGYAMTALPDGSIVVAGYGGLWLGDGEPIDASHSLLVRFSPSGDVDHGFGTNGYVQTEIGYFFPIIGLGMDLKVQADGKLVAVGVLQSVWDVARWLPDGTIDESFGEDGMVTTDFEMSGGWDYSRALAIQPNGGILVAGTAGSSDVALARYLP